MIIPQTPSAIFAYPANVRDWLNRKGKCEHCGQLYSATPCIGWRRPGSDHYRTCLDLAYEYLDEQATEDELNEPQEELELI